MAISPMQVEGWKTAGSQIGEAEIAGSQAGVTSAATAAAAPILSGDAVKVTNGAMTDLEALVSRLKNESEDVRMSVAQRRLAILESVLTAMADKVNEIQRQAILELETLNTELDELEGNLKDWNSAKVTAQGRSALLDVQIAALEAQIENEVQNGADHREQVEKLKEEKASEDAKIADLTNKIASANSHISEIKVKISAATEAIGAATLDLISDAVQSAISEAGAPEKAKSQSEIDKEEKKADAVDIMKAIHESIVKLDEDIIKTIEENRTQNV